VTEHKNTVKIGTDWQIVFRDTAERTSGVQHFVFMFVPWIWIVFYSNKCRCK